MKSISNEPLSSSLRMSNINDFLSSSLVQDKVEVGRYIILTHFMESEVPELLVIDVVLDMLSRVHWPSWVSAPNVVSLINKLESKVDSRVVEEPSACVVKETVLHEDGVLLCGALRSDLRWDSEDWQNVAVFCGYSVFFEDVSSCFDLVGKGKDGKFWEWETVLS